MAKKNSKHTKKVNKNNKKRYNKSFPKGAFVIVFILIIIVLINLKSNVKDFSTDSTQIILNNQNITENLQTSLLENNSKIYMCIEDIQKYLDNTLYVEESTGTIITTSSKKLAAMKKNDENIEINGSNQQIKDVAIEESGKTYLAISDLENVYDYKFSYIKQNNIVVIESLNKKSIKAYAKNAIKLKKENKMFSKTIENIPKGSWVTFISEENGLAKIRTKDGNIGYTKKSKLDNFVVEREDFEENFELTKQEKSFDYDITGKDITTFEKRLKIINLILQQAIKNDSMYVNIIYKAEQNFEFERFKIEVQPMLKECGITTNF